MQIIWYKLEHGDRPINGIRIPFTDVIINGTLKYNGKDLIRGTYEDSYDKDRLICKIDGWAYRRMQ